MPKLLVEKGNNKNTIITLAKNKQITAGREIGNDFQLHDIMSSRKHFKIFADKSKFYIEDMNSSNGTFVNGKRIIKIELNIGDKIQVGDTLMSILGDKESQKSGGMIGKELGGYRIIERLGRGAMGTVYKAVQKSLDRIVALKILAPELLKNKDFINMFVKEARSSGQLNHPNIIQVYDVGDYKGVWYFSMEYAEFGSVDDRIENNQKIPISEAITMIIEACKGLEYAERKQIVHRDIKPDNLFIGAENIIKLGDLGLAQKTGEKEGDEGVFGTPHYIAPEQAMGQNVDQRADIYSLGANFYRMITGETPYQGANVREVLRKQVKDEPPNAMLVDPTIPKNINDLIKKMMAKDPNHRFQSATDIIKALEKAQKLLKMPTFRKPAAIAAAKNKQLAASKYAASAQKKSSNLPLVLSITFAIIAAIVVIALVAMNNGKGKDKLGRKEFTERDRFNNPHEDVITDDDDDDVELPDDDDDDDDDTTNNGGEVVTPVDDDNYKKPPTKFDKREDMFKRKHLFEEIELKMRDICRAKKLGLISADNYTALEEIAAEFDKLALEYKDNRLLVNFDNPAERSASELRFTIKELKKQAAEVDTEFTAVQVQSKKFVEDEEYGKAYSKYMGFKKKFDNGAFEQYEEFVSGKIDGNYDIDFSKVKQVEDLRSQLESMLDSKYSEIEDTYRKEMAEIKKLSDSSEIITRLEKLCESYQNVVDKWAGVTIFTSQAQNKINSLTAELEKLKKILKDKASKAAAEFGSKMAPVLRDVFDFSQKFQFDAALNKLMQLEKLPEFKLCKEQADKDDSANRMLDIYHRTLEQFNYGKYFMKDFEKDLKRSNNLKISKPSCVQDYDVVGDSIQIKGYKDGRVEIKRSGSTNKGNLFINLYEINGNSFFELMNEAMKLSKEKNPKILIGAGFVLMLKNMPNHAMKLFERADSISESKKEKSTIREFLAYAIYDEVNRLNSLGKGVKARVLLEKFKKEFKDTKAYKDIFDPPITVPKSTTTNNKPGKEF
ncbi:MAG: protein kinase [Planctomycetes bacterium]|nr:protein kinase [Planctomycetota bacterium]